MPHQGIALTHPSAAPDRRRRAADRSRIRATVDIDARKALIAIAGRYRVCGEGLVLLEDPRRRLPIDEPGAHRAAVSCGWALSRPALRIVVVDLAALAAAADAAVAAAPAGSADHAWFDLQLRMIGRWSRDRRIFEYNARYARRACRAVAA